MVTDEEYKALQARVSDLEKRMNMLSQQYTSLLMKSSAKGFEEKKQQEHKKHKDITRYEFNGNQVCKRQLVLECVKKYIGDNNISTYRELSDIFPDYIQGSLGVIKKADDAEVYANASKRFYFKDEDLIKLEEGTFVICSQWDANNIQRFIKVMNSLGYEIKIVERKFLD